MDLKTKVGQLLMLLIDVLPVPVVDPTQRKEEDIEYAYVLLALSKYSMIIRPIYPQIVDICFKKGFQILQSQQSYEVHKSFVLDLFSEFSKID